MLTPQEKITLFRNLFRGREDVFAQHWISRDGKKQGWFPVHTDRTNTAYLPLTDTTIEQHLRGQRTLGIYPLQTDNTSHFIVADFDGEQWQKEVHNLLSICEEYSLPTYIERSRSGKGAHVWWFFAKPIPAYKSRCIFLELLKLSSSIDPLDGEISFDRLFPNQDYLSGKGLGNLIALPLQGEARKRNNTLFLNPKETYIPFPNQWEFLQSIQRISVDYLEDVYTKFSSQRSTSTDITQYNGSDIFITIEKNLIIPKKYIFKELAAFLSDNLNFFNQEYAVKQRMGLSTYGTERFFKMIEKDIENIYIPRGFLSTLIEYLNKQKIPFILNDRRTNTDDVHLKISTTLFHYQIQALEATTDKDTGILVAPPGSGKTVMGLELISRKKQPALIMVHRKQIADQWIQRIEDFMNISKKKIGQVVGTKKNIQSPITVAMVQSLSRFESLTKLAEMFGTVIVDECHHMPAKMFRKVITQLKPRYLFGLTATPQRKHNDEKLITLYLGPILYEIKDADLSKTATAKVIQETKTFNRVTVNVHMRHSILSLPFKVSAKNQQIALKTLCFDTTRNEYIIQDIRQAVREGKRCLAISERKEHLLILAEYLKKDYETIILSGDLSQSKRKLIEKQILTGHFQIILATGQLIGEGVHFPHLDALFLVYPFAFDGKLTQYIGRILHSDSATKDIYDYRDELIPYFDKMYDKRKKYYDKHYPDNILPMR